MKINTYNLWRIVDNIKDSITGSEWVNLLNSVGIKDVYDNGLPDIGKANGQRPSKKEYLRKRLLDINGKEELELFFERLINAHHEFKEIIYANIKDDGCQVVEVDNRLMIVGGSISKTKPTRNDAYFDHIAGQIISDLKQARVSIHVAMAWFTNQRIADILLEKYSEGVDVKVIGFRDPINARFGVNLGEIPHKLINGTRGGKMHHKFCVIDNQKVMKR